MAVYSGLGCKQRPVHTHGRVGEDVSGLFSLPPSFSLASFGFVSLIDGPADSRTNHEKQESAAPPSTTKPVEKFSAALFCRQDSNAGICAGNADGCQGNPTLREELVVCQIVIPSCKQMKYKDKIELKEKEDT